MVLLMDWRSIPGRRSFIRLLHHLFPFIIFNQTFCGGVVILEFFLILPLLLLSRSVPDLDDLLILQTGHHRGSITRQSTTGKICVDGVLSSRHLCVDYTGKISSVA